MATSRKRGQRWEFCIRRKGLLPKPIWLSFKTEDEGIAYCERIERLLDAGVVPDELSDRSQSLTTISLAYEHYDRANTVSDADDSYWPVILKRWGDARVTSVDYVWVERQVERCKSEWHLAPGTIRHQVGAMARLWDWLLKRQAVATNPFRALRRGYASGERKDVERDRRIERDEEVRLICELDRDLLLMFVLALETAMRMREIYTLTSSQVDLAKRTIYLDKTKNGDSRQVPLSSTAVILLQDVPKKKDVPLFAAAGPARAVTSRYSVAFGRAAERAGCPDIHFHDTRHEATCRLFEKTTLDWLEISKITGHRDPRMLRRYANLRASDLAARLW